MKISQKNKWHLLLMLYALVVPFGSALPNIVSGLIAGCALYDLLFGKLKLTKKEWKLFMICNSFFFFILLSLSWSTNFSLGFDKASLLALIPLMFLAIASIRKYLSLGLLVKIIQVFSLSTTTLFVVSCILAIRKNGLSFNGVSAQNLSSALVDFHYLSFSIYCAIALISCVLVLLKFKELLWPFFNRVAPFIILILWVAILLSTSRTSIVVTGLMFAHVIFMLNHDLTLKKRLIILALFGSVGVIAFVSTEILEEKIKEAINYQDDYNVKSNWGGRGFRELIWNCSIHLFREHPVIGTGFGDQQAELDLCYKKYRYNMLLIKGNVFNAHNIYLQVLIGTGIIGLFFFLMSLTYPIFVVGKSPPFYIYFILMVMLFGLTESYFNRNAFVSLFAFFNPLILFSIFSKRN